MASTAYLRRKRAEVSSRNSERGKASARKRRERMEEAGSGLSVTGRMETSGSFGNHVIELLACDDPTHVWLRVDGKLRCPRTCDGVKRVVGEWIWEKGSGSKS
jgi:hypothetical protein